MVKARIEKQLLIWTLQRTARNFLMSYWLAAMKIFSFFCQSYYKGWYK